MRVTLFRRGRLAGFVLPDFHNPIKDETNSVMRMWNNLELPVMVA